MAGFFGVRWRYLLFLHTQTRDNNEWMAFCADLCFSLGPIFAPFGIGFSNVKSVGNWMGPVTTMGTMKCPAIVHENGPNLEVFALCAHHHLQIFLGQLIPNLCTIIGPAKLTKFNFVTLCPKSDDSTLLTNGTYILPKISCLLNSRKPWDFRLLFWPLKNDDWSAVFRQHHRHALTIVRKQGMIDSESDL